MTVRNQQTYSRTFFGFPPTQDFVNLKGVSIRFAVQRLHAIFMKVKIYYYIMAVCTKTSEIMQSMDGHNC